MSNIIKATLSMPPSANKLTAGYIRRYKSTEYKDWLDIENSKEIKSRQLRKYSVEGTEWFAASFQFYFPIYNKNGSIKRKDLSNYYKATEDFLGRHVKGFDDKQIKEHSGCRKINSPRNEVEITIWQINE